MGSVNPIFPKYKSPICFILSCPFFSPFSIYAFKNVTGKESANALCLFSVQIQPVLSAGICHSNMYSSFAKSNCKNFVVITILRIHICEKKWAAAILKTNYGQTS